MNDEQFNESVKKRVEQRAKLNKYFHEHKIEYYECVMCDKKIAPENLYNECSYGKGRKLCEYREGVLDRNNGVICDECVPVCPYCGNSATDGLLDSAFEEIETLECYGEIFLFCGDCYPSCRHGNMMGYFDEPCDCRDDDHECDCDYCDKCDGATYVEPLIRNIRRIKV